MDLDFALSQHVLDDAEYADFYDQQRIHGREVILDNGLHELEHPLTCGEILEAAKRCNPTYIVPPDYHLDAKRTHDEFNRMLMLTGGRYKLALVLQGVTAEERRDLFIANAKHVSLLCLPYKQPRYAWFDELIETVPRGTVWPKRFHLLGVSTLEDLDKWCNLITNIRPELRNRFSVDTAKPIKWGYSLKLIDDSMDLRNNGLASKDLVNQKEMNPAQLRAALYNICFLRKWL